MILIDGMVYHGEFSPSADPVTVDNLTESIRDGQVVLVDGVSGLPYLVSVSNGTIVLTLMVEE